MLDNVRIGGSRARAAAISSATRCACPGSRRQEAALTETAWSLLQLLELEDVALRSGGRPAARHPQAGRAGARAGRPSRSCCCSTSRPAGSITKRSASWATLIRRIRDERHVTVLLVEHHMNLVMSVSDKVVALDFGRKIAEGTPAEVQRERSGDRAYLGTGRRARCALADREAAR